MATTYLTKTLSTATSDGIIGTFSFWVKLCGVRTDGNDYMLFSSYADGNNRMHIKIDGSNTLDINSRIGGSVHLSKITNRKFRDTSAWYHIMVAIDTSQGTASNRCKVYINGVQETSFATDTNPSQNQKIHALENSKVHYWGSYGGAPTNSAYALDGLMSHINFIDGTQATPTVFGSTDSTTGEWKINTSPSVTYGNNGYFILKDGNSVTDQSGNSNNFTASGTLTNTEDCPSNVFCTMNPLRPNNISQTYSNGNNTFVRTGTGGQMNGTLGVMSGKWYYECLIDDYWQYLGWTIPSIAGQTTACSSSGSGFYGLYSNASALNTYANGTQTSQGSYTAMASGQIWGIAFDADNAKMYFSVNGVWENSSDPANQTNPAMSSIPVTDFLVPAIGQGTGSRSSTIKINFGNGYFGTTQISSEGTNASGIGKFEYDVPTGYTALSTKGLNE